FVQMLELDDLARTDTGQRMLLYPAQQRARCEMVRLDKRRRLNRPCRIGRLESYPGIASIQTLTNDGLPDLGARHTTKERCLPEAVRNRSNRGVPKCVPGVG